MSGYSCLLTGQMVKRSRINEKHKQKLTVQKKKIAGKMVAI